MNSKDESKKAKAHNELDLPKSLQILGALVYLSQGSPLHSKYSIEMLLKRVGPSLAANSFRYYEDQNLGPIAFVNWASLSDKVLQEILATGRAPAIHEWQSGKNIFFIELIAPFGHCRRVVRDLRESVFQKGQRAFAIRGEIFDKLPTKIRIQDFRA